MCWRLVDQRKGVFMLKNVTLSADDRLIVGARERARKEKRTLNAAFREWLSRYAGRGGEVDDYEELMRRLRHVRAGRRFSRDEANER